MRRFVPSIVVGGILLLSTVSTSFAAVQLQAAVSPNNIPQCSAGQLFVALSNTGSQPIGARVCVALSANGKLFGPLCGPIRLAAGQQLSHEFTFIVPPVPTGAYAFVFDVTATDGSTAHAEAPFNVVAATAGSPCAPTASTDPSTNLLNSVGQGIGIQAQTPGANSTWGTVKAIYR